MEKIWKRNHRCIGCEILPAACFYPNCISLENETLWKVKKKLEKIKNKFDCEWHKQSWS